MNILRSPATILAWVLEDGPIIWAMYGAPLVLAGGALVWWVNRGDQTR